MNTISQDWLEYFQQNAQQLLPVPWDRGAELTAEEIDAVSRSVAEFQLGESSEGRHLLGGARKYAEETGDMCYIEAMRLFIREEQRHARDLGRFMRLNGIPLVKSTAADGVFRAARNLVPSLELSIAVLVTAEIIAKVYYSALQAATASRVLRRLCEQILRDEEAHVTFQCGQLRRMRRGRSAMPRWITGAGQAALLLAAVLVVWPTHRPVMKRAGMAFGEWWTRCWSEFALAFAALEKTGLRSPLLDPRAQTPVWARPCRGNSVSSPS